jgi:hypothetical protein
MPGPAWQSRTHVFSFYTPLTKSPPPGGTDERDPDVRPVSLPRRREDSSFQKLISFFATWRLCGDHPTHPRNSLTILAFRSSLTHYWVQIPKITPQSQEKVILAHGFVMQAIAYAPWKTRM